MVKNGLNDSGANGTLTRNREAMDRFLERLRNSGNVRAACKAAGVPRRTVYRWRHRFVTFRDEWDEALEDACDILEGEAWNRALKKKSDRLLMFLLKAHRRHLYGDRLNVSIGDIDAAIERELEKLAANSKTKTT